MEKWSAARRVTRRKVIRQAAKGTAVAGVGIASAAWARPVVESFTASPISGGGPGSPPPEICYAIKWEPGECKDLYKVPPGGLGGKLCLPETTTGISPGGCIAMKTLKVDRSNKKGWVVELPSGCTFKMAYTKATSGPCDLQEGAPGQSKWTFTYVDSKAREVSNIQFIVCCKP